MKKLDFKDIKVGVRVYCIRAGNGGKYDTTIPTPVNKSYVITEIQEEYPNEFSIKLLSKDCKYYGRYIQRYTINDFKIINNNDYEVY